MIRLRINPAFAGLLQLHHLNTYPAVMQIDAGELIEENESRDVRRLQLDDQVVYLKRTRSEKTTSAFESYARGRLAHSKPFKEMLHFKQLARLEFDVAEVVAVGEELRCGIPRRGFIMTAEVAGEDLAQVYQKVDDADQCRILEQFGTLLGRLHDCGFFGSTRLKDIIYSGTPRSNPKLTLIDRETRNPYPRTSSRKDIIDRLLLNVRRQIQAGERFSEQQWSGFCENYCSSLSAKHNITSAQLLPQIIALTRRKERNRL